MDNLVIYKRKDYIDTLRAISTFGVVMIHVAAQNWYGNINSIQWNIFTIFVGICKLSVPVFFMISGALFLNGDKERSVNNIIKHNIGRLCVFLFFWSFIYKIIELMQGYDGTYSMGTIIGQCVKEVLKGKTQLHLWFVYAMCGLYLLVPLLRVLVKNSKKRDLEYGILFCFVLGGVNQFLTNINITFIVNSYLERIKAGYAIGYIGFFLLGAYLDKYDLKDKSRRIVYILGVVSGVITVCMVRNDCIIQQGCVERFWAYTLPAYYFMSATIFVAVKRSKIKNKLLLNTIGNISKYSLGIYGVHFLFIMILWNVFDASGIVGWSALVFVPTATVFVMVLSCLVSIVLKKIPLLGGMIA